MVIPFPPWSSFLAALSRERLNFCCHSIDSPLNLTDVWCYAETQSAWLLSATGDCNSCQYNLKGCVLSTKGSSGNDGYQLMLHFSILSRPSISTCAEIKEYVLAEWPLSITQNKSSLGGVFLGPYLSPTKCLWCLSRSIYCTSKNVPLWTCWAGCQIHWPLLIRILALNSKFLGLYLPLQCLIKSVWDWSFRPQVCRSYKLNSLLNAGSSHFKSYLLYVEI